MNKKTFISMIVLTTIIGFSAVQAINAQSFEPLRQKPVINEDEVIICTKDVTHKAYFGQLSCIIKPLDDIVSQKQAEQIYKETQSLNDTFEMGLID